MMKFTIAQDKNGNKTLQIKPHNKRGFSIQTNGNLPNTHKNGVNDETMGEVKQWVELYGAEREKAFFKN